MPWNFGFFFHNDEVVVGRRKKLQHTLGVVGSVRLESTGNHDYTGLFTGADYGVVRLSDGGFIHDGMTKFNPSGAMKFFVDGNDSANLLSLANHAGTSDPYFFAKPFSNTPPGADEMSECDKKTINLKNIEATKFMFSTGLGHFAEILPDGTTDIDGAKFPYELIWEPN